MFGQIMQRASYLSIILDKTPIVGSEAYEGQHLRHCPLNNFLYFVWISPDTILINHMA